ncbi:hypothetical protein C4546_00940 [Candidatus Parcubacteria bacterium]|jgi:hypothetical protein|nr:MAG: hypothetical protein C4546_00940 [Candidatus Parcubacteria bacterium]
MTLSLWLLLIPFGLVFGVWLILSAAAVLKMLRFGFLSRAAVISVFLFISFSVATIVVIFIFLRQVDWSSGVTLGSPEINLPNVNDLKNRLP